MKRTILGLVGVVCLAACGGGSSTPTVDGSVGTDGGGTTDGAVATDGATASDGGDLCANLPANNASVITDSVMNVAYPSPVAATGGVIETGLYKQTAHIYYQPATTPTHTWQATMRIDATLHTSVVNSMRDGAAFQQTGSTYTPTTDGSFSLHFTCPAAVAGMQPTGLHYSYVAGLLTVYSDIDHTATVFQKQ